MARLTHAQLSAKALYGDAKRFREAFGDAAVIHPALAAEYATVLNWDCLATHLLVGTYQVRYQAQVGPHQSKYGTALRDARRDHGERDAVRAALAVPKLKLQIVRAKAFASLWSEQAATYGG